MTPAQYLLLGSTTASAGLAVGLILNLAFIINECEMKICAKDIELQWGDHTKDVDTLKREIEKCRAEIASLSQPRG